MEHFRSFPPIARKPSVLLAEILPPLPRTISEIPRKMICVASVTIIGGSSWNLVRINPLTAPQMVPTPSAVITTTINGAFVLHTIQAHCCRKANNRTYGNINLTKYQNVCHRQHYEDFCQINRHLTKQTAQVIIFRKHCTENIYCNKQQDQIPSQEKIIFSLGSPAHY